jgi:hypothetical protein
MSVYFKVAMPADGTLAARSHARISASPASRAATQNLADFTGTLYPPIGGYPWSRSALGRTGQLKFVAPSRAQQTGVAFS